MTTFGLFLSLLGDNGLGQMPKSIAVVTLPHLGSQTSNVGKFQVNTKDNFGGISFHVVLSFLSEFRNGLWFPSFKCMAIF